LGAAHLLACDSFLSSEHDAVIAEDQTHRLFEKACQSKKLILQKETSRYRAYDDYFSDGTPPVIDWCQQYLSYDKVESWERCDPPLLITYSDMISLNARPEEVWSLFRDTPRLAKLVPGVHSVIQIQSGDQEQYTAVVSDKVGPFKVSLNLDIELKEIVDLSRITAAVKGADLMKLSRANGAVSVALAGGDGRTDTRLQIDVEILGKLATLGATVIRRRLTEQFQQFSARLQSEFEAPAP